MYNINYNSLEGLKLIAKLKNKANEELVGYAIPIDIAEDMVNLIPNDWFKPKGSELIGKGKLNLDEYANNHRVLDICCNTGILLDCFLTRFRSALRFYVSESFKGSEDSLCEYIIKNLLYGISCDRNLCKGIRGILYNNSRVYGNIYHYNIFSNNSFCDDRDEIEIVNNEVYIYNREKGDKISMKFDVVCGNPPYNKDIYLDFVMLGHKIAKTYDLWITPAKFWAKSTCDKDKEFRDMIKNSGDSFVVYKDCKEIFDISEPGGIAYYLLKKGDINTTYKIKCVHKSSIAFQSAWEVHKDLTFLPLSILNILDKIGISDFKDKLNHNVSYFIDLTFNGSSNSSLPIKIFNGKNLNGYTSIDNIRNCQYIKKYKCIQAHTCGSGAFQADSFGRFLGQAPIYILKENEIGRGFHHLKFFDTELEAKNFVAFMSTKLVNFLYILGVCGTCNSKEFYRYIPDPDSFDKIYEDRPIDGYVPDKNGEYIDSDGNKHCSLYVKYKLTQQEIDVIESVIRERK